MTDASSGGGNVKQAVTPPSRMSPHIVQPGELLANNFLIEDVIGQGGMAVVYKAMQKSLNRYVAIKVLHPKFARDREFVNRFEAEAGALASLQHPNIVNIIDRGHDANRYFFIMEYVEGETLDQQIIQDRLTPPDWRRVIEACRAGLEYVHRRGMVHRDVKPSNILVGQENLIKIGDFGIAHILASDPLEQVRLQAPKAMGTANYMAPEQTQDPSAVDHRADIYSLGVTFYKMFTRTLPTGAEFPLPSEANTDVPVSVDDVILKSIAQDRDARYQSVETFCEDLIKALKVQSTSIAAVMTYRKGPKSSALYTGADFRAGSAGEARTPKPKAPQDKTRKKEEKSRKKGDIADSDPTFSKSDMLRQLTPLPVEGERNELPPRREAKKTPIPAATPPPKKPKEIKKAKPEKAGKTPSPVLAEAAKDKETGSNSSKHYVLLVVSVLGALAIIGGIAYMVFGGGDKGADTPSEFPTETVTQQRERVFEELLRDKMAGEEGSNVPVPETATPEPPVEAIAVPPTPVAEEPEDKLTKVDEQTVQWDSENPFLENDNQDAASDEAPNALLPEDF